LRQAEERERLRHEVTTLRATLGAKGLEPLVVAEDPKMRSLLEVAARAAAGNGSVLITGERGTGKALLARAMHRFSRRGDAAFVAIDCVSAPDLFGGLDEPFPPLLAADPQAIWRSAARGTLLLEEVTALTAASQDQLVSRLMRHETGEKPPSAQDADVRIMATTQMPLERLLREGRVRTELAELLTATTLDLPPLRERPEDVPALVTYF